MNIYQTLYFMSLAGGTAGLLAWATQALLVLLMPAGFPTWSSAVLAAALLGAFIGGFTVAFDEKWSGNRVKARWVAMGALIGLIAGMFSGAVHMPLREALPGALPLGTVLGWMISGALIGAGLGARWLSVNRARLAHGMVGGMCGGFLGGLVFATLSEWLPGISQAVAFVFTGMGISFGIAFAPILLRDAVLRFVNSGDARASNKLGKKEWAIQDGDSYVLGSQSADFSKSTYGREVDIYLPDSSVASRHARIYGRDGRFYVIRHPDVMSEAGLRRYVLKAQNKSITAPYELRDQTLIVIGRTTLMFIAKQKTGHARG
ncbi:MAG TPA: FHA domain-containing protein [Alloacidobacterium sp.]|nr:FHA domain-containing protein [Alloacidobacterium sp.]